MGLEIVRVAIGMRTISAIFMESSILPEDQETIQQIAAILTGQHELSDTLLEDAKPGTTAFKMGAKTRLFLAFPSNNSPSFWTVQAWARTKLTQAMPTGQSAGNSNRGLVVDCPIAEGDRELIKVRLAVISPFNSPIPPEENLVSVE